MAGLRRLQTRLIGMSGHHTVEEVAGELAKWLASTGVSFAMTLGKAGLDALEFVGRGLMQRIAPEDSNLPTYTAYFPTHLYSIRVLEESVNKKGEWKATDQNLKLHNCDMNWCHCASWPDIKPNGEFTIMFQICMLSFRLAKSLLGN